MERLVSFAPGGAAVGLACARLAFQSIATIERGGMKLMAIRLNPETETLIKQKVASGLYPNAEAALDTAVQLLDEHDRKLQRLRELIAEGEVEEGVPWTPELMEQIIQEADEMHRRGELPDPDVCP